jgi:hypothetical protein
VSTAALSLPSFEQGPIRPPSEAYSLLVRVVRNCTWNRCTFCPVYKGTRPSQRAVEEILADVDAMAAAAEVLRSEGRGGLRDGRLPREAMQVALFLHGGERHVFLQDADPLAVRPEKLARVVERVRERFPTVDRVTTYGRAATIARRRPEQLELLRAAGLTRVHLGLESGADEVLMAVEKGCTSGDLIEAGTRVTQAGLELCFYLMPGLGGRELASAHVAGSARVLRAVADAAPPDNPLVVRLRTAAVVPGTPLAERHAAGGFELPDDVEIAAELRDLLERSATPASSSARTTPSTCCQGSRARCRPTATGCWAARGVPRAAARAAGALRDRRAPGPLRRARRPRRPRADGAPRARVRGLPAAGRRRAPGGGDGAAGALPLRRERAPRRPASRTPRIRRRRPHPDRRQSATAASVARSAPMSPVR